MKSYWRKFFIVTFFMALFSVSVSRLAKMQPFEIFTISIFLFYAMLSPVLFFWASNGITSKNNYKFVSAITGSMTVKLLLSLLFVVAYAIFFKPAKPYFIIPFFVDYSCYTILEVVEMMKLTKSSNTKISSTDSTKEK